MPDPTPVNEVIAENAAGPKSVTNDGVTVNQRDLDELIKADKHLSGRSGARKKNRGIGMSYLRLGGTR